MNRLFNLFLFFSWIFLSIDGVQASSVPYRESFFFKAKFINSPLSCLMVGECNGDIEEPEYNYYVDRSRFRIESDNFYLSKVQYVVYTSKQELFSVSPWNNGSIVKLDFKTYKAAIFTAFINSLVNEVANNIDNLDFVAQGRVEEKDVLLVFKYNQEENYSANIWLNKDTLEPEIIEVLPLNRVYKVVAKNFIFNVEYDADFFDVPKDYEVREVILDKK